MAKLSRNKRKAARVKRERSGVGRELRKTYATLIRTHMALLGVLAQCGGEKEVTVGTLQQVSVGMGWVMEPIVKEVEDASTPEPIKSFMVRMVVPETGDEIYTYQEPEDSGIENIGYSAPEVVVDERSPHFTGLCCLSAHARAVAPWTCDCSCHLPGELGPDTPTEQMGE